MTQFLQFGDGSDGDLIVSSTQNINTNVGVTGSNSSGAASINVGSNSGFEDGCMVIIHQTRGTNAGVWEKNRIKNSSSTVLNLAIPLSNTYNDDGGANQAQVIRVPEYKSITINSVGKLSPNAWDGDIGGLLAFVCNGTLTMNVANALDIKGKGFRGGNGQTSTGTAQSGEGTAGDRTNQTSANGNGGGGSNEPTFGDGQYAGGGGGGNGTSGGTGDVNGSSTPGTGGSTAGSTALDIIVFGGGGGGSAVAGSGVTAGGNGGRGAGALITSCRKIVTTITTAILADGDLGTASTDAGNIGSGASGAGGSVLLQCLILDAVTNFISALGGAQQNLGLDGGPGGNGRVRIETCKVIGGTSNPSASLAEGGHKWCGSGTMVM